jgi:hypothetical protein
MNTPFDGFAIKKSGQLMVQDFGGYETRNPSTLRLITDAVEAYGIGNFDWVLVNTGDQPINAETPYPIFSYSTTTDNFDFVCPDFIYDHWKQTGLDDYEETRLRIGANNDPPQTNKLGWRGAHTHASRIALQRFTNPNLYDIRLITWDRKNPDKLQSQNFMSFEQQIQDWRFLIDVEGVGYSARLKLLLCAPRVVFVQDRPFKDLCFRDMVPWVHYVPAARDFSDLEEKVQKLLHDPQLENEIKTNARMFANTYLTRAAAVKEWAMILARYVK